MKKSISLALAALLLTPVLVSIAGCNTMEGVGEDLGAAGDKIENSAEKHKDY